MAQWLEFRPGAGRAEGPEFNTMPGLVGVGVNLSLTLLGMNFKYSC